MELTKIVGTTKVKVYALAQDGPNAGEYVEIQAAYDSSLGVYGLYAITSGSSSSSSSVLMETGDILLMETGDQILLDT